MNKYLGQHWVLLRGLARESAHWGEFVPLLQAAFPQSRISLIDLPGTGLFYHQQSPASISAIVEQVRTQVPCRHKPVTLLALSLGGMVAWEWLQKYPDNIAGAVLINTSFGGLTPFYRRLRWQSYGCLASLALQHNSYNKEQAILRLVSNGTGHDAIARQWHAIQTARPISAGNRFRQICAAAGFRPDTSPPHCPVLLLTSQQDRLVASACSHAVAARWQLPLSIHSWAGHDLPLDDGPWVIAQIKAWLVKLRIWL